MKIYIVGNRLIKQDNLPYALLPILRDAFPAVICEEADPNENFLPEEGSVIIDTVEGISDIGFFDNLDAFVTTKSVTAHDYDLGFHLQLLKKLHKITSVGILGLPQRDMTDEVKMRVIGVLREIIHKNNSVSA